jgi:hypothetical protein
MKTREIEERVRRIAAEMMEADEELLEAEAMSLAWKRVSGATIARAVTSSGLRTWAAPIRGGAIVVTAGDLEAARGLARAKLAELERDEGELKLQELDEVFSGGATVIDGRRLAMGQFGTTAGAPHSEDRVE